MSEMRYGNRIYTALLLLSIAALISSILTLGVVLPRTGDKEASLVIETGGEEQVITINRKDAEGESNSGSSGSENSGISYAARYAAEHPGLRVRDEDGIIWTSRRQRVNIFKLAYLGEKGYEITAATNNGDKIIAPGTENSYAFDVKNIGKGDMGYYVTCRAWTDGGLYIPLDLRLRIGKRVIEDELNYPGKGGWYDIDKVTVMRDDGTLKPKNKTTYTLDWKWPFGEAWKDIDHDLTASESISKDQDRTAGILGSGLSRESNTENTTAQDQWDTLLGNAAVNQDLTATVEITVVAWTEGPSSAFGVKTGDNTGLVIWICIFLASLLALFLILILISKNRRDEEAKEEL